MNTTRARVSHRYETNPATGHVLRIDRVPGSPNAALIYLLVADGGLVELGHVTMVTRGVGFAHPAPALPPAGWACSSYLAGAIELDTRISATPITSYVLRLNGD